MELATFSRPGAVVIKSEGTVISSLIKSEGTAISNLGSAKNNYDAGAPSGAASGTASTIKPNPTSSLPLTFSPGD